MKRYRPLSSVLLVGVLLAAPGLARAELKLATLAVKGMTCSA